MRPLATISEEALDQVNGGNMCTDTPEERERKLERMNVGTMEYRRCRIEQHCQNRANGMTFDQASRRSYDSCAPLRTPPPRRNPNEAP